MSKNFVLAWDAIGGEKDITHMFHEGSESMVAVLHACTKRDGQRIALAFVTPNLFDPNWADGIPENIECKNCGAIYYTVGFLQVVARREMERLCRKVIPLNTIQAE